MTTAPARQRRRDPGRALSRLACGLLALVGLLPLVGLLVVRQPWVRERVSTLVLGELRAALGLEARFGLALELLPPSVVLTGLEVSANDGGGPALAVERARVVPRIFSLLGGRVDVGDIELIKPRVRLVIADGKPANVTLKLPESKGGGDDSPLDLQRPPLRSLTVEDAHLALTLRDQGVELGLDELDLDVTLGEGAVEVNAQLYRAAVQRRRVVAGEPAHEAVDDDVVCGMRARVRYDEEGVLVRRFDLDARLDADEAAGRGPSCDTEAPPESVLTVGLRRLRVRPGPGVALPDGGPTLPLPAVNGRVEVQGPLRVIRRFVPSAPKIEGEAGLQLDLNFSARAFELPEAEGRLTATGVRLFGKRTIVESLDASLQTTATEVRLPLGRIRHSEGDLTIHDAVVRPLEKGVPLHLADLELRGVQFPALMKNLGITPHTIVRWTFDEGHITNFKGNIADPVREGPALMGDIVADTSDFELGDRGWDDPRRRRVVSVRKARVRGRIGVEPDGVLFRQMVSEFARTRLDVPAVTVGFSDKLEVRIGEGTHIELADITPLLTLPVAGRVEVSGGVCCTQSDPKVEGNLKVTGFQMAGLPLADTMTAHAVFKPMVLELTKMAAVKGGSSYESSRMQVDFGRPQGLLVEGGVSTGKMDFRDLLAIFQFEKDPRYAQVFGTATGQASLRFEVGGPNDPCDTGVISLRAQTKLGTMSLYGERYDGGEGEIDFTWFDRVALERGMDIELRSLSLRKGRGIITGAGAVRRGAVLTGHFLAQDVPLSNLDAMGDLGRAVDGSVSASGRLAGTVEGPKVDAVVRVSPVRIGQKVLPASTMSVRLVPTERPTPAEPPRRSPRCKEIIPRAFDPKDYARDDEKGVFHVEGELFGGQLKLSDVQTTWQRAKRMSGEFTAVGLDLGALLQLSPTFVLSERPPTGTLSGQLSIQQMELDHLDRSELRFAIQKLELGQGNSRVRLRIPQGATSVGGRIASDELTLDRMLFELQGAAGVGAAVGLSGRVSKLTSERELDLEVKLPPIEIGSLLEGMPRVESAAGTLDGSVVIQGRADAPIARGELRLTKGSLSVRGAPVSLEELEVVARIDEQELRVVRASARAGGGQLQLTARLPLRGLSVSELSAQLEARGVRVVLGDGIEMVADASLGTSFTLPGTTPGPRRRPRLTGAVTIQNFRYTRPIGVSADLDALARKGKRTEVVVYDPEDDMVDLAVRVFAPRPLLFRNNLLEADVSIESSLLLTGTNQRFGLQGMMRVNQGGRLRLRSNEFDIRQGTIRFDDPLRIAPWVDLQANTDYRRVSSSASSGVGAASATAQGTASSAGLWRIQMHAYGDADNLKIDLTSDPNLAQEDIILLITVGMTRAELDQLQASNLGSTAALEALSALAGADRAVKTVIPIIDDFRFGSAYSPRTGRTEPTVTVGKRVSERVRANVVTGLSENRDVRSNLEWRISPNTSILGNYDNLSDVASRGLGNLGADFRVRLEF